MSRGKTKRAPAGSRPAAAPGAPAAPAVADDALQAKAAAAVARSGQAAQVAEASKAAAAKAGKTPKSTVPVLTPMQWSLCYDGLTALLEKGFPGAGQNARALATNVLIAQQAMEPHLAATHRAAQAAQAAAQEAVQKATG